MSYFEKKPKPPKSRRGELARLRKIIRRDLMLQIREGNKLDALRLATERSLRMEKAVPKEWKAWWNAQRPVYLSWVKQQIWEELIDELERRRAS